MDRSSGGQWWHSLDECEPLSPSAHMTRHVTVTLSPLAHMTRRVTVTLSPSAHMIHHVTVTLSPSAHMTHHVTVTLSPSAHITCQVTVTLSPSAHMTGTLIQPSRDHRHHDCSQCVQTVVVSTHLVAPSSPPCASSPACYHCLQHHFPPSRPPQPPPWPWLH